MGERLDPDLLREDDPFEIDTQAAYLFKHPHLGLDDVHDVWASDPLFYEADHPPAHWLMVAEVGGKRACRSHRTLDSRRSTKVPTDWLLQASAAQAVTYGRDRDAYRDDT